MKQGALSQYFSGVAFKRLSAVEASPERSNQHELNGVTPLKTILGPERREFKARFFRMDDNEPEPLNADGILTWYDARENHATRTEWRLYYSSNQVTDSFQAGDMVLVARDTSGKLLLLAAAGGSTSENQIRWLFGLEDPTGSFQDTSKRTGPTPSGICCSPNSGADWCGNCRNRCQLAGEAT